jgi:hypothetical protein
LDRQRVKEGTEDVGDDPKSGHPSTAKTQENVEKVTRIVRGDLQLSIRAISKLTNTNKESVRQILHGDLGMKKVCAKWCQKSMIELKQNVYDAHKINSCVWLLPHVTQVTYRVNCGLRE